MSRCLVETLSSHLWGNPSGALLFPCSSLCTIYLCTRWDQSGVQVPTNSSCVSSKCHFGCNGAANAHLLCICLSNQTLMPGEIVSPAIRRVARLSQFNFLTPILNYIAIYGHFTHLVAAAAISSSSLSSQFPPFPLFPHLFSFFLYFSNLLYHLLYSAFSLSVLNFLFLVVIIFGNTQKVPIIGLNKYFEAQFICYE